MSVQPPWIAEIRTAVESMWSKLRKYYKSSDKPMALIDSTLLHPALKVKFMNSVGYKERDINRYRAEAEKRFTDQYVMLDRSPIIQRRGQKRSRPMDSDSSSDAEEYNEFNQFLQMKRDRRCNNPLEWWSNAQSLYPKLAKMARDVFAVPATGAGVEREFSISGRVITKQRNRLSPTTIRDLMQYKRWAARHGRALDEVDEMEINTDTEADESESELLVDEDEEDNDSDLVQWCRNWVEKHKVSEKVQRLGQRI